MNKQQEVQENILHDRHIKDALNHQGYQYQKVLGEGSFGVVVQAKYLTDGKETTCAIKLLRKDRKKERYRKRELKILQTSSLHENIVKYITSWPMTINRDEYLCIQMELCQVSLWDFVYNNKIGDVKIIKASGPPRFYQQVFPQLLKGLIAIHSEMGCVHRDIHPRNILIASPTPQKIKDITVKIADFSLAREIRSIIDESQPLSDAQKLESLSDDVGNKEFRAPELKTGNYDYKVDLYSSGIVLYFLTCYLEDKNQLGKEILAFREGKRRSEDLCFHDDKHLVLLIQLLMQEREKRPTAEEALKIAEKLAESQEPVESQKLVESQKPVESQEPVESQNLVTTQKKRFFIKKIHEKDSQRCTMEDDFPKTISSLKEEVQRKTGIEVNSQILHQQTTVAGAELVQITSDNDVRDMFHSANEKVKDVVIIVSDSKKRDKNFLVGQGGKLELQRCSTEDTTLADLQAGIENCLNIKANSQVLYQERNIHNKKELLAIKSDEHVKDMFDSAEKTGNRVVVVVSENISTQNELSTDDSNREVKRFLIKKESSEFLQHGSIEVDSLTLSSLKEEIKKRVEINAESQVLRQQKGIHGEVKMIDIKSDEHVQMVFQSAHDQDIVIVVSPAFSRSLDMYH